MPRDERERYAKAFWYAVRDRKLTFAHGGRFADW
jgi:hypothetical protein